jgi:hypothetical protein
MGCADARRSIGPPRPAGEAKGTAVKTTPTALRRRAVLAATMVAVAACGQGAAERTDPPAAAGRDRRVAAAQPTELTVEQPRPGSLVASPLRFSGEAQVFEVRVLVCDADLTVLGRVSLITGIERKPFSGEVPFSAPSASAGTVQFFTVGNEGNPTVGVSCVAGQGVPVRFAPFTG